MVDGEHVSSPFELHALPGEGEGHGVAIVSKLTR